MTPAPSPSPSTEDLGPAAYAALAARERATAAALATVLEAMPTFASDARARGDVAEADRVTRATPIVTGLRAANLERAAVWEARGATVVTGRLPDELTPVAVASTPTGGPVRMFEDVESAELACARAHVAAAGLVAAGEGHAALAGAAAAVGEGLATLRSALGLDPVPWAKVP